MANEINRIVKLFADLQHGNCWIGINFREVLQGMDAADAADPISENTNSIWQLVAHIIYWRTTVANRLSGNDNPPAFRDFKLPDNCDEENWKQIMHDFEAAYHLLQNAIQHFSEENLHKPSLKPDQTNFQLIMGCLQHDAYHLGQMMLLKKTVS